MIPESRITTDNSVVSNLRKRMETPIGDHPAARINTARSLSGRNKSKNTKLLGKGPISISSPIQEEAAKNADNLSAFDPQEDDSAMRRRTRLQHEQEKLVPVVGEIVEKRQSFGRKKIGRRSNISSSVCTSEEKNCGANRVCHNQQGFPSLHVPLVTFVPARELSPSTQQFATHLTNDDSNLPSSCLESLKTICQREADTLLGGMSIQEIKGNKSHLKQTMSPAVIRFLTKRQKNAKTKQNLPDLGSSADNKSIANKVNDSTKQCHAGRMIGNEVDEKIRLSKIVAAISTYEDLDNAYENDVIRNGIGTSRSTTHTDEVNFFLNCLNPISAASLEESDVDDNKDEKIFKVACVLLRSSSQRQKLWALRIVNQCLLSDIRTRSRFSSSFQYVTAGCEDGKYLKQFSVGPSSEHTLIVSLRCLLDEPVISSYGVNTSMLVYSLSLQAIYSLLLLYSSSEHFINVRSKTFLHYLSPTKMASQFYAMDDVIYELAPTELPSSSTRKSEYFNHDISSDSLKNGSTEVSTAENDAKTFSTDPMWTLLIKMKILPRLEQIMIWHKRHVHIKVPFETVEAICGILSMICMRVPSAATAMLQLKCLLPTLKEVYFPAGENVKHSTPFLILLITASRQSRLTLRLLIDTIDLESVILQAMAVPNEISRSIEREEEPAFVSLECSQYSQKLALVLWRIMIRYGMGLSFFPAIMTLTMPYITLGYVDPAPVNHELSTSLSVELYSCFAAVAYCAYAAKLAIDENENPYMNKELSTETNFQMETYSKDDLAEMRNVLSPCLGCLLASRQHAMNQLLSRDKWGVSSLNVRRVTYFSSVMKFIVALHNLAGLYDNVSIDRCVGPSKSKPVEPSGDFSLFRLSHGERADIGDILIVLLQANLMSDVLRSCCRLTKRTDLRDENKQTHNFVEFEDVAILVKEAAACSFVDSLVGLINAVRPIQSFTKDCNKCLRRCENFKYSSLEDILMQAIHLHIQTCDEMTPQFSEDTSSGQTIGFDVTRRHWMNMTHFSLCTFLLKSENNVYNQIGRDIGLTLLGRLEKGDERVLAILSSSINLCVSPDSSTDAKIIQQCSSPLSLFVKELCRTKKSRTQLDHSYRLNGNPGIVAHGLGPFGLLGLLNGLDRNIADIDQTIPVGKYWLWKMLSGEIGLSSDLARNEMAIADTVSILRTVLQWIKYLENCGSCTSIGSTYAQGLTVGGKLFHLFHFCLFPEVVLCDLDLQTEVEYLFDTYLDNFSGEHDMRSFIDECCSEANQHPIRSGTAVRGDFHETGTVETKGSRMLHSSLDFADGRYSNHEIRLLITCMSDICNIFIEYGYKYRFFTKVLRFFLTKWFPTKVRCETINRLGANVHLLSLVDDHKFVPKSLCHYICGGRPSIDCSIRDYPDLLDDVAKICSFLRRERGDNQGMNCGFLHAFCVGILSRSVVAALEFDNPAVVALKRRMMKKVGDPYFVSTIFETASRFAMSIGTLEDLVNATTHVCFSNDKKMSSDWFVDKVDNVTLRDSLLQIQKCMNKN